MISDMRTKKINKIIIGSPRKLVLSNRERAIRILEVSDGIPSSSFEDRLVKETSVPVTTDRPILFVALSMVSFIFGQDRIMLIFQVFLEANVLPVGRAHLQLEKLIFNGMQLIRDFWFAFAPFLKVFCKVESFQMKRSSRGITPTLPGSDIIIILKEPPILKFEDFVMLAWFRV